MFFRASDWSFRNQLYKIRETKRPQLSLWSWRRCSGGGAKLTNAFMPSHKLCLWFNRSRLMRSWCVSATYLWRLFENLCFGSQNSSRGSWCSMLFIDLKPVVTIRMSSWTFGMKARSWQTGQPKKLSSFKHPIKFTIISRKCRQLIQSKMVRMLT